MRTLRVNYDWNPIETAPPDEDIALQVTDGRGEYILAMSAHTDRLDQFEEGKVVFLMTCLCGRLQVPAGLGPARTAVLTNRHEGRSTAVGEPPFPQSTFVLGHYGQIRRYQRIWSKLRVNRERIVAVLVTEQGR